MKRTFLKLVSLWLPPLLWAALIFHFSSGTVPVASPVYWQDFTIKKFGHMLLFGFLAILIYRGLRGKGVSRKNALIWAVIIATLYGGSDEYHQMFTQGRESRLRDVGFDGLGALVFTFITYEFLPKFPKKIKIYLDKLNLT